VARVNALGAHVTLLAVEGEGGAAGRGADGGGAFGLESGCEVGHGRLEHAQGLLGLVQLGAEAVPVLAWEGDGGAVSEFVGLVMMAPGNALRRRMGVRGRVVSAELRVLAGDAGVARDALVAADLAGPAWVAGLECRAVKRQSG